MKITVIIKDDNEVELERTSFNTFGFDYMRFIATLDDYLSCRKRHYSDGAKRYLKELIEKLDGV